VKRPRELDAFCLLARLPGSSLPHVIPAEPDALIGVRIEGQYPLEDLSFGRTRYEGR